MATFCPAPDAEIGCFEPKNAQNLPKGHFSHPRAGTDLLGGALIVA
jgi:hypothetical protein